MPSLTREQAVRILGRIHGYWDLNKDTIKSDAHPWHQRDEEPTADMIWQLTPEEISASIGEYSPKIRITGKIEVHGDKELVIHLDFHTERPIYREHRWSIPDQCVTHSVTILGDIRSGRHETNYYSHPPGTAGP